MTKRGDAVAARARRLVGVRFRPQGRGRETGLDCVGLVAAALRVRCVRSDYALRGGSLDELEAALRTARLTRIDVVRPGDVLVLKAGPGQLHLAVATEGGFVHAHAGLGKVVETPGAPEWPLLGIWRKS
ncbi:MAG TPA: peptidoglycan endopeptidase [Allosphingosinicella sp.]|uniref:peptidoglycan endopeptidase n=1 Tax=Allosphingosinicella sp. TaxID=2823234 RepID=UPI002ED84029